MNTPLFLLEITKHLPLKTAKAQCIILLHVNTGLAQHNRPNKPGHHVYHPE